MGIQFVVQYKIFSGITFGLLTILLRYCTSISSWWLDVMYQQRSSVCTTKIIKAWFDDQPRPGLLRLEAYLYGPVLALGLTRKNLAAVKGEIMEPTRRPSVSSVLETMIFLWTPSRLISGGPLWSLMCSARVRGCLRLLVGVMDWFVVGRYGCSFLLKESVDLPLTCLPSDRACLLSCMPSDRARLGVSCKTWTFWLHILIWVFFLFSEDNCECSGPHLGSFPSSGRKNNVTPILKRPPSSSVANYWPISISSALSGDWASGVGSSRTIYEMQYRTSYHPVCLSARSGYLWCAFLCVPYTDMWPAPLQLAHSTCAYEIIFLYSTSCSYSGHPPLQYELQLQWSPSTIIPAAVTVVILHYSTSCSYCGHPPLQN